MIHARYSLIAIAFLFFSYTSITDIWVSPDDGPQFPDLFFVQNAGQWDDPSLFHAHLGASSLFVEKHALTYSLIDPNTMPEHGHEAEAHDVVIKGHAIRVDFIGAANDTELYGSDKKEAFHNYYLGADSSKWKSHVPLYGNIHYTQLYNEIDLNLYQTDGLFKYDFIVGPKANASAIQMSYSGLDDIYLYNGHLYLINSVNDIIEKRPYSYQVINGKKTDVKSRFVLKDNIISFEFPDGYNDNYPLIIDPILVFSTFTGSAADNFGVTAAFDQSGNGYAAGMVFDNGYPTTFGAFQIIMGEGFGIGNERVDVGISKFNQDGTALVYSTYLGGNQADFPHSLVVNSRDELVVLGTTSSLNFPIHSTAFDPSFNGGTAFNWGAAPYINGSDIFIAVFNSNGQQLRGSTFLGGSGNDGFNLVNNLLGNYGDQFRGEVITDGSDNIYVASMSSSSNFPTTTGAYAENRSGLFDVVVAKLNSNVSQLTWATFYGGSNNDVSYSMKLDENRNVYFAGGTESTNLPTSTTAIEPNFKGGTADGFLGKLSANGSQLLAATYLGTTNSDQAYFVELDPAGDVFVLGDSREGDYPVTPGRFANPGSTQFVHKLKPDLDSTFFSTVFGNGSPQRSLSLDAFMIDDCDRIYISGWGGIVNTSGDVFNMPISSDAFQSTTDGSDFYFIVLSADANGLEYATYFGGTVAPEHVDGGTSRFDRRGIIYQAVCAGCMGTSAFPTSSNAYSRVNGSTNCNLALIKFDFQLSDLRVAASANPFATGCAPLNVRFDNLTVGPVDRFEWHFGDGEMSTEIEPIHIYDTGTHQVMLIGISDQTCIDPDTAFLTIEVLSERGTTSANFIKCAEESIELAANLLGDDIIYEWNNGTNESSITVTQAGTYWVKAFFAGSCFELDSFIVENFPTPSSSQPISGCEVENYNLQPPFASPTATYSWQDGSTGESFRVTQAGIYWVRTSEPGVCDRLDSFIIDEYPLKDPIIHQFDLCPGKRAFISPTDQGSGLTHQWQDGSSNDSLVIFEEGIYWVITSYPDECPQLDSFIVMPDEFNEITLDSFRICEDSDFELSSKHQDLGGTYLWSTGETSPSIVVNRTGLYEVTTEFKYNCPFTNQYFVRAFPVIDQNDIYFPNAFSPNDDAINDIFKPFFSDLVEVLDYEFKIYDRWGKKVFESRIPKLGWDGFESEQPDATGVYVWYSRVNVISCTGEPLNLLMKGDVTLIK